MEANNKGEAQPLSKWHKIKNISYYPILVIAATWYILMKNDTFKIDWPLVLFIIGIVTHTIAIAYYYPKKNKYAKEGETKKSLGLGKTGNYFLSTGDYAALIGFGLMFDFFRL